MAAMVMETVNNMLIEIYTVIAQAEVEKKEKRKREGIKAKKERAEWADYGRPRVIDFEVFKEEYKKGVDGEMKPFECMKLLGMTKPTFYRNNKMFDEKCKKSIKKGAG
jgi:DNA invertase Pin-like site-specific DNA recombinase